MRFLVLLFLLLLISILSQAQDVNITISEKHLNKVEKAETGREKLKKYRKYYQKDSAKHVKKMKKYWQAKSDSLSKAQQQLAKAKAQLPDSTTKDSLKNVVNGEAQQYLAENEALNTAKSEAEQYSQQVEELKKLQNKDSLKATANAYGKQGMQKAEGAAAQRAGVGELKKQEQAILGQQQQLEQYQAGEYASKLQEDLDITDYKDQVTDAADIDRYKNQAQQYTNKDQLKAQGQEQAKQKAVNFFKTHADKLKPAQKEMAKLQQKYRSIANSNELDKAIKRNSLEGKPLRERLFIGGHFNVNSTDPLSLDLSPKLGYKLNKRWVVGIGGTYRKTFSDDSISTNLNMPNDGYGYSGFTSYDAVRGFFVYGEYERMTKDIAATETTAATTQWIDGLMLGIGRKFSVHRSVNMQVIAMYNFLHTPENALYTRPLTVKVGFSLSELAMLKK